MAASELQTAWDILEKAPTGTGIDTRTLYASRSPLDLCAALRPDGTRMFIFACDLQSAAGLKLPPSSEGLERKRLQDNEFKQKCTVGISLRNIRYRELFDAVIEDVCLRALSTSLELEAFKIVLARIADWQKFFSEAAAEGLSEERRRGLYGELSFLRRLISCGLLEQTVLQVWTGPSNADQDYQFRKGAVEVKVSLSAQNQQLVISSERQLDTRGFQVFFVYHLSLAVKKQTGETLNAIVDSLRSLLSIEQQLVFTDLLFEYGYLDTQRAFYDEDGYVVRESNYFEVREGFPRITEELTRTIPGVGKVKYCIDVPYCSNFKVSEDQAMKALRGLYD